MHGTLPRTATSHAPSSSVASSSSFYTVGESVAAFSAGPSAIFRRSDQVEWGSLELSQELVEEETVYVEECTAGVEGGLVKDGTGYPVKSLPNGLQSLPSARSSFDLSVRGSSPRPVQAVLPVLPVRSRKNALTHASPPSSDTTSSHSHPTSHTTATPPRAFPPRDAKQPHTAASNSWGAHFWCVVSDPFSPSNTFFANPATGECRWALPAGTMVLPPSGAGEWWQLIDEQSGREYFYHTRTEERRWTPPDDGSLVIPMVAVQLSAHAAPRVSCESVIATGRDAVRDRVEQVMTPLRPRTRSLPQTRRAQQRLASAQSFGRPAKHRPAAQKDLQKASESIISHDRKALADARRICTPPFSPRSAPFAAEQPQPRSSTRKTPLIRTRLSSSERHLDSAATRACSPRTSQAKITRIGKGLAFHPGEARVKPRRSLPFLNRHHKHSEQQQQQGHGVPQLPPELAAALLTMPVTTAARRDRSPSAHPGVDESASKTKRNKLARLIGSLAPCRSSSSGSNKSFGSI